MKKLVVTFLTVVALVMTLTVVIADSVSAAPAVPVKGTVCWVRDANFVIYVDNECEYHEVWKYDEAGNRVALLNYQDHGHLPPGAALPTKTVVMILHVASGPWAGDYREVLTPNGEYHSQGPMIINN